MKKFKIQVLDNRAEITTFEIEAEDDVSIATVQSVFVLIIKDRFTVATSDVPQTSEK